MNQDRPKAKSTHGGARPGAGRPPKAKVVIEGKDMLEMLQAVALGAIDASPLQVRAAIAAVQYTHVKKCDGGKKDDQADAAKKASAGRFHGAPTPPRLVAKSG